MKYRNDRDGFFLPNELFQLGLDYGELAVYSFLKRCENRKTHRCWPSIKTIGQAVGMSENTVRKYIRRLEERELMLHRVLKRAGLSQIRFHDLRHTFATLALQNGVDVKTVSGMLGHYSAGFTLDAYAHVTTSAQRQAAEAMERVLSSSL